MRVMALKFYLAPNRSHLRDLFDRFRCDTDGLALVETTILMPFLLLTCAGVFEFGNLLYQKLLIEAGVRDAARYVARCTVAAGFTCSDSTAQQIAVYGVPAGGIAPRVDGWAPSDVLITRQSTANPFDAGSGNYSYRGGLTIDTIRVTTSYTYDGVGILPYLGLDSITLSAVHEERYIGW